MVLDHADCLKTVKAPIFHLCLSVLGFPPLKWDVISVLLLSLVSCF